MANQKISQMPSLTASELAAGDLLAVVDVSDVTQASSGSNKKITLTDLQSAVVSAGTANGVLYLNGSKQATSGSALTFDGTTLNAASSVDAPVFLFGVSNATTGGGSTLNIAAGSTQYAFPSVRGDTILRSESNSLVFGTASEFKWGSTGAEWMRLTSTGLGIGTSSPTEHLSVKGSGNQRLLLESTNASGVSSAVQFKTSSRTWEVGQAPGIGDNSFTIYDLTAGAVRAQIDSSGNLGLGVTPSAWGSLYKAFTQSSVNTSTYSFWDGAHPIIGMANGGFVNAAYSWEYTVSGRAVSRYAQEGDGAHKWYTAPSGTAGDTISFTQAMDLANSAGASTLTVNSAINNASAIRLTTSGALNAGMFLANPTVDHSLGFQTAGSERARIDSSGNLLVGLTAGILHNSGSFQFSPGTGSYGGVLTINHSTSNVTGSGYINFGYNGSAIGSISQNGTTSVSYNTSSDYRLKNITGPVTNSGAYIDSLNPVEGTWKADGSTFVGLIAHEVQEVSRTQVATGVKDGEQMQAMDYSNSELIANLIAEVKSLRARVAALESN